MILVELPHSSKLVPTKPIGPQKIPTELLRPSYEGGLPIGREALRPSEPHHSPDKATPRYYSKNESFTSGISKIWCVSSYFHYRWGIYRVVGELHQLGEVNLAPSGGQPVKPRGQPTGWSGLHQLSPLLWPSTPRVDMCPRSRGPNRHNTWPAGLWALSAWGLAHLVHVSNTPSW
jgi:hypothetical protein